MSEPDVGATDAILDGFSSEEPRLALEIPAFVRRGQYVEAMLQGLDDRCRRNRLKMLDMVHMRLRQWAVLAIGPEDWHGVFLDSLVPLWPLSSAEPPIWARKAGSSRRRRVAARDLIASIERFNGRWITFVDRLDLRLTNEAVEIGRAHV